MFLSRLVGESGVVLAFEPQRMVFQTLCANMAINSISNVHTFYMAASSEEGFINIPNLDFSKTNNFGGVSLQGVKTGTTVQAVKLDSFINKINRLKLLKVDVEGMEIDVISGSKELITKFKPIIYIENDRLENSEKLIDLIKSLDYRLYWHLPKLFNENNFYQNKENIFTNLVSVNMLCVHKDSDIKIEKMQEVVDSKFHPMRKGKK